MVNTMFWNAGYAESLGCGLGAECDSVQAALLNGFAHGLQLGITANQAELQIAYITDKLTPEAKRMLVAFRDMIEVEKEDFK